MCSKIADLTVFIDAAPWRFARTMADMPHEYVVRGQVPDEDFESFVTTIRSMGYKNTLRGRTYTYLDVAGHRYWTMGAPLEKTTIINRAEADPYHTTLQHHAEMSRLPSVDRAQFDDGSVAFVHDIREPLPDDYDTCDVLYADLPSRPGSAVFDERAGVTGTFQDMMWAVARITSGVRVPVVLTLLKGALGLLPAPPQVYDGRLNGVPTLVAVYGALRGPAIDTLDSLTATAVLSSLAQHYHRVGDFACGYGRAGRIFRQAGGSFVMSDYNPQCVSYVAMNEMGWGP